MKKMICASLAAMLLGLSGGIAVAEEPAPEGAVYGGRLLRRREEQSRKDRSEVLRLERAHYRARQRLEQEARYDRMGYSPLRPYTNTAYWAMGLENRGGR
jgi:hypothetical protein